MDMPAWLVEHEGGNEALECFYELEDALKIKIPASLKNILIVNGFSNKNVLSQITDNDIFDMEKFMADTFPSLTPAEELEKYYGIFHKMPQSFKFLPGHKKLIITMANYLKNNYFPTTENNAEKNKSGKKVAPVSRKDVDVIQAANLPEENSHVLFTLKNWFKGKCTADQWIHFEKKFCQISIECEYSQYDQLRCKMTCFCKCTSTILKCSKGPGAAKRWLYGNFHKHLQKHVEHASLNSSLKETAEKNFNMQRPCHDTKKKIIEKNNQSMLKFIKVSKKPEQNLENINVSNACENHYENLDQSSLDILEVPINTQKVTEPAVKIISVDFIGSSNNSGTPCKEQNIQITEETELPLELCATKLYVPLDVPSSSHNVEDVASSKWKSAKYSRRARSKRKREGQVSNQHLISTFINKLNQELNTVTSKILEEENDTNVELKNVLQFLSNHDLSSNPVVDETGGYSKKKMNLNRISEKKETRTDTISFLEMLHKISLRNENCTRNHNSYNSTIKEIALYLFYIGGRLLYETIYANLQNVLPSITSLNRFVNQISTKVEEGVFDFSGLSEFLERRHLPKVVWISEDGTRVTGKIEYKASSNKLVGFTLPLKNGLPQTETFLATSAKAIKKAFEVGNKSNYAYLIMAQPLSASAPAYCLAVFGTDNRFTANDVVQRWNSIKENAKSYGIEILGFSSDGDTRLLKAMRQKAALTPSCINSWEWEWFHSGYTSEDHVSYVQDTVHIGTKLRTRLLKPNVVLPIGKYFIKSAHIKEVIKKFSKDKHLLVMSDLNSEDKMNFEAAEKICSSKVTQLLPQIPEGEATCEFLNLMRLALLSYLDKNCSIESRLYNIWYVVFFLRIWRNWINDHSKYNARDNFITQNCYVCLELNAHSLIHLIINFRDNPMLNKNMFLPSLFSSQTCEKMFRCTRSMTSTFSTVVNYSINDIMRRLDRIQAVNFISNDLKDVFTFPREQKKISILHSHDDNSNFVAQQNFQEYPNDVIQATVESALNAAIKNTGKLGVIIKQSNPSWTTMAITEMRESVAVTSSVGTDVEEQEFADENQAELAELDDSEAEVANRANSLFPLKSTDISNDLNNPKSELYRDLCDISSLGVGDNLILRDFSSGEDPSILNEDKTVSEKGPFVSVYVGSKYINIKKSSLCWLLEQSKERVSTDRLRRFFSNNKTSKPKARSKNIAPTIKKQKNKKKYPYSSSSSDSDSENDIELDDRSDIDTDSNKSEEHSVNTGDKTPEHKQKQAKLDQESFSGGWPENPTIIIECGKFYAAYYEQTWYLCRINQILSPTLINMTFLMKSRKKNSSQNSFNWPKNKSDVSDIERQYIFYGPVSFESVTPHCVLSDIDFKLINDKYIEIKNKG